MSENREIKIDVLQGCDEYEERNTGKINKNSDFYRAKFFIELKILWKEFSFLSIRIEMW